MFQMGQDMSLLGFDPDLTKATLVVEAGSAHSSASKLRLYNLELVKGTPMAEVPCDQILYMALACSHLTGFLRAMQAEAPWPFENIPAGLGHDGRLSMECLREKDAAFYDAALAGITYTVLKASARDYPEVLRILQEARNAPGHVQRATSQLHGLMVIYRLWSTTLPNPDFVTIKRAVLRDCPVWGSGVDAMITFVAEKASADGKLLHTFADFMKTSTWAVTSMCALTSSRRSRMSRPTWHTRS